MKAGCCVVDNSSAFRQTDGIPLVVPEVNPDALKGYKVGKAGLIANPNCSTIIALTAVTPLHRAATVTRMVVSTYQAASGAGAAAMRELEQQTREALTPQGVSTMKIFPFQARRRCWVLGGPPGRGPGARARMITLDLCLDFGPPLSL